MNFSKSNKKYVSETNLYLRAYNNTHPLTLSQFAEMTKYQAIFEKRDGVQKTQEDKKDSTLWEGF